MIGYVTINEFSSRRAGIRFGGAKPSCCRKDGSSDEKERIALLLTSDMRHFIDMVYIHSVQKGFVPLYVSQEEFKHFIEEIRRFDRISTTELDLDLYESKVFATINAYENALIVYGYIKELAQTEDLAARSVYDTLKQLMPFRIS